MKSKFSFLNSISLKILASYLSILLIPLFAVTAIYYASTNALLTAQKQKSMANLQETANMLGTRLEELHNVAAYIQSDKSVNNIINGSRYGDEEKHLYALYMVLSSSPRYDLVNTMVEDVYIFFLDSGYIARLPHAIEQNEYNYNELIAFHGLDYDEMMALCHEKYTGELLVTSDEKGTDVLILRSIPTVSNPNGLIVLTVNVESVEALLAANETGPRGSTYVLDSEGGMLASVGDTGFTGEQLLDMAATGQPAYREIQHEGDVYLIYVLEQGGLTFISLVQKSYLLDGIAPLKYVILVLIATSLTIGTFICLTLWQRRRRVVNQISDTAKTLGIEHLPAKSESMLLQLTVNSFADTVSSLRETVEQQAGILQVVALRNLLYGTIASPAELAEEFSRAGLPLESGYYHVVNIVLPAQPEQAAAESIAYRIALKQLVESEIPLRHLACDMDNTSLALLLMEEEKCSQASLKELFTRLAETIRQHGLPAPSFLLSLAADNAFEVTNLYEQTEEIRKYMECLTLTGVYTAGDIPQTADVVYFPVNEELRFIQMIKSGTKAELTALCGEIAEKNLKERTLGPAMLVTLRAALQRAILRAIGDAPANDEVGEIMQRAQTERSIEGFFACAEQARCTLSCMAEQEQAATRQSDRRRIQEAVEQNLADPAFSLYILSGMTGIPENQLYRSFKGYFGVSFTTYLEQCRIGRAMELLRSGTPVKEVALKVGYTSDHTFRRAFKRVTNVLPSQFIA